MVKTITILFLCFIIVACNSSTPQSDYENNIKQIKKEQKMESEDFARFVKRNPDVISRDESANNNRLVTGDEQREIHDRVVSAINRERGGQTEQVTQSMSDRKAGRDYSGVYTNSVARFSIQFPSGWVVQESSAELDTVIAKCMEDGSLMKVSRSKSDDSSPLTLNKARMMGEYILGEIQQKAPSARLLGADIIRNFNGHEAIVIRCQLPGMKMINFIVIPYNNYNYSIGFEGQNEVLRTTAAASITSFKILE